MECFHLQLLLFAVNANFFIRVMSIHAYSNLLSITLLHNLVTIFKKSTLKFCIFDLEMVKSAFAAEKRCHHTSFFLYLSRITL